MWWIRDLILHLWQDPLMLAVFLAGWTSLVASATRWTVRREAREWIVAQLPGVARREVYVARDRADRAESEVAQLRTDLADARGRLAAARRAIEGG